MRGKAAASPSILTEAVDLVPSYLLKDPRRSSRMTALVEVLNGAGGRAGPGLQPLLPLLSLTCEPTRHGHVPDGAPELAQVFATSRGDLLVAPLIGRRRDWLVDMHDQPDLGDQPQLPDSRPATLSCLLLGEDIESPIWLECREHGLFPLAHVRVIHQAETARRGLKPRHAPEVSQHAKTRVVRLAEVADVV